MHEPNFLQHAWQWLMNWLQRLDFSWLGNAETFRWPLGQQAVVWAALVLLLTGLWTYVFRSKEVSRRVRFILLACRCTAAATLLWMLMGPAVWTAFSTDPDKTTVLILADVSASMKQQDVSAYPDKTRWQAVGQTWLSTDYLAKLSERANVRAYHFDKQLWQASDHAIVAGESQGRMGTDLFGALDRAVGGMEAEKTDPFFNVTSKLSQAPGGIILMLSDGHDTQRASDPALLARLKRKGWVVNSVAVGSDQRTSDVAVLAWADSDFVLQGQKTTLHAAITQHGYDGMSAKINLLHEGRLIDSRMIRFNTQHQSGKGQEEQVLVDFEIEPESTGRRPLSVQGYQIAVEPLADEKFVDNNRRWVFLQVSREQIRIALFEGQPYWDTRFLAQSLGDDTGVELSAIYGLGAARELTTHHATAQSLPPLTLPLSDEQLARYDIIILGRGCEQFFPGESAQLLVDFVRKRGGALILARGKAFDTTNASGAQAQSLVNAIEPVQWGKEVVDQLALEMAPAGRRSPLLEFNLPEDTDTILTRMPDMLAATRIVQEKAASVVLLTQNVKTPVTSQQSGDSAAGGASGMAALVHQNAGAGQVLAVLSDGMWQWAFLPGSLRRYDSVYQQFWSRTIRWLATGGQFLPGQSVSLSLSRLSVEPGDEVTATVAARYLQGKSLEPQINVIAPDGSKTNVALGLIAEQANRWSGRFKPAVPGVHIVELLTPGMEPARSTARLAVYDQSAEVLDPSARPMTLKSLSAATDGKAFGLSDRDEFLHDLQRINLARKADRRLEDVFDQPWPLVIFMLALALEWMLRRRRGLV